MLSSSIEYKKYIADLYDQKIPINLTAKATITLTDSTVLQVDDKHIAVSGVELEDTVNGSGAFEIGCANINELTLRLNNVEDTFSNYDFANATVKIYEGAILPEYTEWFDKGIYTVDTAEYESGMISLVCVDNMYLLDKDFSGVPITAPCTAGDLLQAICDYCGVVLATPNFTNDTYVISRLPDEDCTCRELVSWIAQLSGNFARCNNAGHLELKWYKISAFESTSHLDGGYFDKDTPYSTGDFVDGGDFTYTNGADVEGGTFADAGAYHHIFAQGSLTIGTDDIVITGVRVKAMGTEEDYGETYLYGSEGYVILINDNPLITENNARTIAEAVGAMVVGMRFRQADITTLQDPTREAGDVAYLTDRKQNTYQILISSISHTIGSFDNITCEAESPNRNSTDRYSSAAKAVVEARKTVKQQIQSYDEFAKVVTETISNGLGLYTTTVGDSFSGRITYMHDKPTMSQSMKRWYRTTEGYIQQTREDISEEWVTTSGTDIYGNALFNTIITRGLIADWIISGKLKSKNYIPEVSGMYFDLDNGTIDTKLLKLTASGGTIAGWNMTADSLYKFAEGFASAGGIYLGNEGISFSNITTIDRYGNIKINPYGTDSAQIELSRSDAPDGHNTKISNAEIRTTGGIWGQSLTSKYIFAYSDEAAEAYLRTVHVYGFINAVQGTSNFNNLIALGNLFVQNNLNVAGTKNRIIDTSDFGMVKQYCYETASPYFGDIGEGITDENGICYVDIDTIFAETIEKNHKYQVFLQPYGDGDFYCSERASSYFIVQGTPNTSFAWEIKAKQRDYETERLETYVEDIAKEPNYEIDLSQEVTDYEQLADKYLSEYEKEMLG